LLLDFGGTVVISDRGHSQDVLPRLAQRVHRLINGVLTLEEVEAELKRADELRDELRREESECLELTHERLWGSLVADLWPDAALEAVVAHAAELTYEWTYRRTWRPVDGMPEVLDYTLQTGLPVAIISNTACGQAFRDALELLGLGGAFAVQIYSDELGRYKPHPEMVWAATRDLDVPTGACWMVGDTVHRDIEVGRRAGVGAAILMSAAPDSSADATVLNGHELLKLLLDDRNLG
jgi:FMN phosphatase YigB (HAD superfamily)